MHWTRGKQWRRRWSVRPNALPSFWKFSYWCHIPELLIHSYFNIVKREMIDMVPKAVALTLVNYSKENLQRELLQELYKPEVLDELLKESDYVVSRRKEVQSMVQALNKAEEYVLLWFWSSNANSISLELWLAYRCSCAIFRIDYWTFSTPFPHNELCIYCMLWNLKAADYTRTLLVYMSFLLVNIGASKSTRKL